MSSYTNRLAKETSPYLLQHAHNPVDWYPWGEEAFKRARDEDKAVLLSVGYSACHWCHVMEHESFENEEIARLMNGLFVCIKVDREERPDVDHIYMQAVQSISGHGGWPMTVFLTPDGVPFYGGTYYPAVDRHGLPGFPRVLQAVAEAYRTGRDEVVASGRGLVEQLRSSERLRGSSELLTADILHGAFQGLAGQFDERHGGHVTEATPGVDRDEDAASRLAEPMGLGEMPEERVGVSDERRHRSSSVDRERATRGPGSPGSPPAWGRDRRGEPRPGCGRGAPRGREGVAPGPPR